MPARGIGGLVRYLYGLPVLRHLRARRIRRAFRQHNANFAGDYSFYQSLNLGPLVFDIGANRGDKADVFLELGSTVVAAEPDPHGIRLLEKRFHRCKKLFVEAAAVGAQPGHATLHVLSPGQQLNTLSNKWRMLVESNASNRFDEDRPFSHQLTVPVITLDQMIARHGRPSYVKIDVEGFELPVLHGLSQPVALLSFECNLPEMQEESMACVDKIQQLAPDYVFNAVHKNRFFSDSWMSGSDIKKLILKLSHTVEIYCRRQEQPLG